MSGPLVFNIQKFSTHDGDGVRTSIFFKGCPLRCRWCHNPESQRFAKEMIFHRHKCTACGRCVAKCPQGANSLTGGRLVFDRSRCTACGVCADWCFNECREIAGREYTVEELVREAKKDLIFYDQSGGGVTLSGGEVLSSDIDYIEELCRRLKSEGISVFVDTSGCTDYENIRRLLPYVDIFLYDVKLMDPQKHMDYIGADNSLILGNLVRLSRDGGGIYLRLPIIDGVNADEEFIGSLIDFVKKNDIAVRQVNLLPYHEIGKGKYSALDRIYNGNGMAEPGDGVMRHLKTMLETHGFDRVQIGG